MSKVSCRIVTTDADLEGAFAVRREVFVDEQGVDEETEYDGLDGEAVHVVVTEGQRIVGTARVRFPAEGTAKIERMAVLKRLRRRGIGTRIMSFLAEELTNRRVKQVVLHSQCAVTGFYESCGFEQTGSPFWEAGIRHIEMHRRL